MSPGEAVALFSIGVLVAVLAFLAFETYNAVVALRLRIDKAWANIDVALKQRHDMLPALVSAVRGLMQFEQDVLVDVTRARAAYSHRTDPRPGGGVGRDDIGGPFAVRRRRAVPEHSVSGQRPRPAERDRADRGPDRRPTRALQRPVFFQYTRIAQVPALPWPRSSDGGGAVLHRDARGDCPAPRSSGRVTDPTIAADPEPVERRKLVGPSATEWSRWPARPHRHPADGDRPELGRGARQAAQRATLRARPHESTVARRRRRGSPASATSWSSTRTCASGTTGPSRDGRPTRSASSIRTGRSGVGRGRRRVDRRGRGAGRPHPQARADGRRRRADLLHGHLLRVLAARWLHREPGQAGCSPCRRRRSRGWAGNARRQ